MTSLMEDAERKRQQGLSAYSDAGYHGKSPMLKHLPYLSIHTVAVLPFMHAFFQGIVKDFLKAIFGSFPSAAQRQQHNTDSSAAAGAAEEQQAQQQQQEQAQEQGQDGPAPEGMGGAGLGRGKRRRQGQAAASAEQQAQLALQQQQQPRQQQRQQQAKRGSRQQQQPRQQQQQQQQTAEEAAAGGADVETAALPASKLLPHTSRRVITQRASGYKYGLHPQKNRQVRDPVKYKASLHFDELSDALLLYAPLFWPVCDEAGNSLKDVVPDQHVREGWRLLVEFGRFQMQDHSFNSQAELEAAALQAHQAIIDYGKLCEQVSHLVNTARRKASSIQHTHMCCLVAYC
jgi:hypothetical protein